MIYKKKNLFNFIIILFKFDYYFIEKSKQKSNIFQVNQLLNLNHINTKKSSYKKIINLNKLFFNLLLNFYYKFYQWVIIFNNKMNKFIKKLKNDDLIYIYTQKKLF